MDSIEPRSDLASANQEPTIKIFREVRPKSFINAGDARFIEVIRGLSKKTKKKQHSDTPILACGQRTTLVALVDFQCQSKCPYRPQQGVICGLDDLDKLTCHTTTTTASHLRALAKRGWIHVEEKGAGRKAYFISAAIELYAEVERLEGEAVEGEESEAHQAHIKKLKAEIADHLQINCELNKVSKKRLTRAEKVYPTPPGVRIIELAMKIAEHSNMGLVIGFILQELIALCTQLLDARGQQVVVPEVRACAGINAALDTDDEMGGTGANLSMAPAPDACVIAHGTPNTLELNKSPLLPPSEDRDKQKLGSRLRNEMMVLACRIDEKIMVPQVLAFVRTEPTLQELQAKVKAMQQLERERAGLQ